MGNKCCCQRGSSSERAKRYWQHNESNNTYDSVAGGNHGVVNQLFPRDETSMYLQHISEREPEEGLNDPSTHPTAKPIFMERSKSDMRIKENRRSFYVLDAINPNRLHQQRKSNSCSTIFVDDSTITQPNLKNTIKCISLAIYYHIAQRKNRGQERVVDIFDERAHPISRSHSTSITADPDHRSIYRFVRTLFHAAQLTAECAIITLVYIERLLNYAEMELYAANWRRVVLGAIMMASKVWDDQAVWNVDYCQILPDCKVDDMNELERQFLEMLEFNINVPSSVYAKYYFDLRTLAMANDLQLPVQPLSHERALKLEALSRDAECHEYQSASKSSSNKKGNRRSDWTLTPATRCRKWSSAERLHNASQSVRRAPVIIS